MFILPLNACKILPVFVLFLFPLLFLFPQEQFDDDEYLFIEDEGITVIGVIQASQQIDIIDRQDIERRGKVDLAEILQETLNLGIVSYGTYGNQTGINIRGFDSKRVAFLVNGVPANS